MTATIDPSRPGAARALERLDGDLIGWITTVDDAGQPHGSPIWFRWVGGEIVIYSHRAARRNGHIQANPRVAFNLETADSGDEVVAMTGIARIDPGAPPLSNDPAYLGKYGARIAGYGWTPDWMAAEYPVVIRITPTRWRFG
jgi:PPOX class probable F420-dependent enzyme